MANGFQFESEMPGFQAPQPQSQGGGGSGLLDVLGKIGSAIGQGALYASAGLQAGQGNPQLLSLVLAQRAQEEQQQRQQNLLGQLQTFAEQADPDVKDLIQNQLKFGQPDAALKTAANAFTFTQFKRGLETSRLSPELKKTISNTYLTNPGKAADMLRSLEIVESQMGAARQKEELRRETRESKSSVKIIEEAFKNNLLQSDDPQLEEKMISLLAGQDKRVTPELAKQMITNPQLAPYFKAQPAGFFQRLINKVFGAPQQPQAPAPAPAAPAAPQQPSAVRKFNPATGRLE